MPLFNSRWITAPAHIEDHNLIMTTTTTTTYRLPLAAHNARYLVQQHKALPQSYKPPMPTTFVMETRNDVEDREEPPRPVFRRRQVWLDEDDELNDIWSLKRANPVIDEDDEEPNVYESPSKRPRVLQLQPSCSDDEEPPLFDIAQLWQRP